MLSSVEEILVDVKSEIYAKGKELVKYDLPDGQFLMVEVIKDTDGDNTQIEVWRSDTEGKTIESAVDDYNANDTILRAMIENAMML